MSFSFRCLPVSAIIDRQLWPCISIKFRLQRYGALGSFFHGRVVSEESNSSFMRLAAGLVFAVLPINELLCHHRHHQARRGYSKGPMIGGWFGGGWLLPRGAAAGAPFAA